eukprot:CAMPEP_0176282436 /NCGR_PEP_ID=MMETSP0121_2-20121125/50806_1 /TAXON_ID=160619 /ORGANISM="Kryptoperidinium foliaceum, Strain CCMP 1326" /LENGTH=53 /DNA_ID=CAMNT_0017622795 /DNA_START=163 /DNA_END=320 /DNA_ORIENTATION=+
MASPAATGVRCDDVATTALRRRQVADDAPLLVLLERVVATLRRQAVVDRRRLV